MHTTVGDTRDAIGGIPGVGVALLLRGAEHGVQRFQPSIRAIALRAPGSVAVLPGVGGARCIVSGVLHHVEGRSARGHVHRGDLAQRVAVLSERATI